jgi:hypothetical protein
MLHALANWFDEPNVVRFYVLTSVMRITLFWDVMTCNLIGFLHITGRKFFYPALEGAFSIASVLLGATSLLNGPMPLFPPHATEPWCISPRTVNFSALASSITQTAFKILSLLSLCFVDGREISTLHACKYVNRRTLNAAPSPASPFLILLRVT